MVNIGISSNHVRSSPLPDLLAMNLDVLFCGINPALTAARYGHHCSSGSNRFWKVLYLAGCTSSLIEPENDRVLLSYKCGLTAAVARPTSRAGKITTQEFVAATDKLKQKVSHWHPRVLAFLGKAAFTSIFKVHTVAWGRRDVSIGETVVWVLPNPSGLNRAFTLSALVALYRELRMAVR